jgi:transketolase
MLAGVADALADVIEDERYVLLLADAIPPQLQPIVRRAGRRSINVGIAEATLVSFAAGLAMAGFRPIVVGLSPFLMAHGYAQVRQDVALDERNITLISFASGDALADMGPSHCTLDDLALASSIPQLALFVPNDDVGARAMVLRALGEPGPQLVRVERGCAAPLPRVGRPAPIERHAHGDAATIVTMGAATRASLTASHSMKTRGLGVGVVSVQAVRPLDAALLRETLDVDSVVSPVLVAEVHQAMGGLHAQLAAACPDVRVAGHVTPRGYMRGVHPQPGDFGVSPEAIEACLLATLL